MSAILFVIGLISNAAYDGREWRNKRYIDKKGHLYRFLIRGFFFTGLSFIFHYDPQIGQHASLLVVPYVFTMAAFWWLLFDILVNLFGGQRPFHLGRTALFDAIFWRIAGDRYGLAISLQYLLKITALALGLYLISPSGLEWFEIEARRFYFNMLWSN